VASIWPICRWTSCKQFSQLIEQDIYQVLTPEGSLAQRDHVGGTAPNQVRAQIARHKARLAS
jgi:argininosuccinate lyase